MMRQRAIWSAVLIALALMAGVGGWATWRTAAADAQADAALDHRREDEAIQGARLAVQARRPDADKITYDKVSVRWLGDSPAVCGLVDIEEALDSLSGPARFVYVDGQVTLEEEDGSAAVTQKWNDVCKAI